MIYRYFYLKRTNSGLKNHCQEQEGYSSHKYSDINAAFRGIVSNNAYYIRCGCGCEDSIIAEENKQ